jgi:hypothetical protein
MDVPVTGPAATGVPPEADLVEVIARAFRKAALFDNAGYIEGDEIRAAEIALATIRARDSGVTPLPAMGEMNALYEQWVDGDAYLDECGRYGSQQAAFYAGFAAAAPIVAAMAAAAERARIAALIEAAIVADPADRYQQWPCRCLEGEKCYPHACHDAMNRITARCEADAEGGWPVIQAGALWDELEPLILRAAASIARSGVPVVPGAPPPGIPVRALAVDEMGTPCWLCQRVAPGPATTVLCRCVLFCGAEGCTGAPPGEGADDAG